VSSRHIIALAALVCIGACGGSTPTAPTPPIVAPPLPAPAPLQITCPAPLDLRAVQGQPVPLSFGLPETQGGTAPVTVACTPAPGAAAPVGQTSVACLATDSRAVTAACEFSVRVVAAPLLGLERFLALGDSLTFGTTSRHGVRSIAGNNYVEKLQTLLADRYFDERPTVVNAGLPGEWAEDLEGRYGTILGQHDPQVLILLSGTNDLLASGAAAIPRVTRALESMARDAQQRRIRVILSTLPPQRPDSVKGMAFTEVVELNAEIRGLCARYRVPCADVYAAMGGDFSPLIGSDGLHPTLEGYDRMAETYFAVIASTFESR
jgi:lysophospholipase L1-like esterase